MIFLAVDIITQNFSNIFSWFFLFKKYRSILYNDNITLQEFSLNFPDLFINLMPIVKGLMSFSKIFILYKNLRKSLTFITAGGKYTEKNLIGSIKFH